MMFYKSYDSLLCALVVCGGALLSSAGCSAGDSESSTDAGSDAGASVDAGDVLGADAQDGLPNSCTGDCATMSLVATFGGTTRNFDRAFFGLTSPQKSESGDWEVYIENGAGDDDQCPTMKSPTPDFLLLLAGMPLATLDPGPITATANLLDFEGDLLTKAIREEATSNTVTWAGYDPCIACAEGTEPDRPSRMVAVDIEATFASGTISGHSYATHCDSLDDL